MCDKIRELDKVILPKYLSNGKKITKYEVDKLTAPGENYGSLMFKLDITISDKNGEDEILYTVAKMVPDNELVQKLFNTQVSFKKELEFYRTVVPVLEGFQKERGVENITNFFPRYFGGRINLDPKSDLVDQDAIIILENLKASGFECGDRNTGFDFETACFILKDLAVLHAVALALKVNKPKLFESKLMPHLQNASPIASIPSELMDNMMKDIIQVAGEYEECLPYIECLSSKMKDVYTISSNNGFIPREPFATFTHSDYWVNNTMIKLCNGEVIQNKMVDFQLTEYNSPAKDFLFFVFDSIQNDVIKQKYDEFLKVYHGKFIATLKQFEVDVSPFSYQNFLDEIELSIKEDVFLQMFLMLRPIFALKETGKDVENFNEDDFKAEIAAPEAHREKLRFIIGEFAKRQWLLPSE